VHLHGRAATPMCCDADARMFPGGPVAIRQRATNRCLPRPPDTPSIRGIADPERGDLQAMQFCVALATEGTVAYGAHLDLDITPAEARC
jgi:hypothetical protein